MNLSQNYRDSRYIFMINVMQKNNVNLKYKTVIIYKNKLIP